MVLSAHAGDLTLRELEQKINNLDKLEQNMERLEKEVTSLKMNLKQKITFRKRSFRQLTFWIILLSLNKGLFV